MPSALISDPRPYGNGSFPRKGRIGGSKKPLPRSQQQTCQNHFAQAMQSPLFISFPRGYCQKQNKRGLQRRAEPVELCKQPSQTPALERTSFASYLSRLCICFGFAKIILAIHISLERRLQRCETPNAESIFLTIRQTIDENFPGLCVKERKISAGVSAPCKTGA